MVIPNGDEAVFEQAIEMLSETDWALPLQPLSESTKSIFFGYFGQPIKANSAQQDE